MPQGSGVFTTSPKSCHIYAILHIYILTCATAVEGIQTEQNIHWTLINIEASQNSAETDFMPQSARQSRLPQ